MNKELKDLFERREYFNCYLPRIIGSDRRTDLKGLSNSCPSCGYPTLDERCTWDICSICFWEDDGQDDQDANQVLGGPNGDYSLTQHRIEWSKNLNELKNENSEIGKNLTRLDRLIKCENKSDVPEILDLINTITNWFDHKREFKK